MLSFRRTVVCGKSRLISYRNYRGGNIGGNKTKTVEPIAIRDSRRRDNKFPDFVSGVDVDVEKIKREFRQDVKNELKMKGDISGMDGELFEDHAYDEMIQERKRLQSKIQQQKMFRKHFRDTLEDKEINILTYAEKEKIRYLHSTNSEEWNPEALAAAFPISPEGVIKMLKSGYRAKSFKEIQTHDQMVAQRIKKIKSGEIEMTPDLDEKMKMRDKIPLKIGAIDPYDKDMLLRIERPNQVIGEFQSLVAAPSKLQAQAQQQAQISSPENASRIMNNKTNEYHQSLPPDIGDHFKLEPNAETINEFRKMKLSIHKTMTFEEFTSKMKLNANQTNSQEVQYLSKIEEKKEPIPVTFSDFENSEKKANEENIKSISKFRQVEDDNNAIPIIHGHNITSNPDHIEIPPEIWKEDAVYKVENSFYDHNGDFLYRVV